MFLFFGTSGKRKDTKLFHLKLSAKTDSSLLKKNLSGILLAGPKVRLH
jgi:hypothetical protein